MTTTEHTIEDARQSALLAVTHVEALVAGDEATARATLPTDYGAACTQAAVLASILADVLGCFGDVGRDHLQRTRAAIVSTPDDVDN